MSFFTLDRGKEKPLITLVSVRDRQSVFALFNTESTEMEILHTVKMWSCCKNNILKFYLFTKTAEED